MSNLCDFRTGVIETYEFPSTLVTKCNQGLHRSDTASRMVQSICNTMVDGTGKRIFNANYWALSEASTSAMARQMVEDSKTWIEDPWTVIRGAASVEEMYGYNAVVNDHNAFVVHRGIVQTLTRMCPMVFQTTYEPKQERSHPGGSSAVQRGAQPPSSSSRIDARSLITPWATTDMRTVRCYEQLRSLGADDACLKELFSLAQMSIEGRFQAEILIGEVAKKSYSGQLESVSDFIRWAVVVATHQVEDRALPSWKKQRVSRKYDSSPVGWQKDWENCRGDPTKMPARLGEGR